MNTKCYIFAAVVCIGMPQVLPAQKSTSDLMPPTRRQTTVDIAERLARPPVPAPVPDDLPQPFNPPGFDLPDGAQPSGNKGTGPRANNAPVPGVPAPVAPPGDREILEILASRLPAAGSATVRGKPILIMGTNRFEVGTKFTAVYNNQDYELELVAIGNTSFTLRYRNEEFIRPNRPTR
jgi:hypothetical protein